MDYLEIEIPLPESSTRRYVLMQQLFEEGFESFREENDRFWAYIPSDSFHAKAFNEKMQGIDCRIQKIAEKNWNEEWESDYQAVMVENRCYVYAPFHPPEPAAEFQLLIQPKMSFGTAHHATTRLMIRMMLMEDLRGKSVLDMGCGTAVLAILARMKKAASVSAVDNNSWAVMNANENVQLNKLDGIKIMEGDATLLNNMNFDSIWANINKNVLLADLDVYERSLNAGGHIFLSGFFEGDVQDILKKAEGLHLHNDMILTEDEWVALKLQKQ